MPPAQSPQIPPPGTKPRLGDLGRPITYCAPDLIEQACTNPVLAPRIGYATLPVSARLPWRSDCVIQAMAAQNWLAGAAGPSGDRRRYFTP